MEVIIFLVIFFGGIWLIGLISEAVKKQRAETREQVAKEIFGDLNMEFVISGYNKKLEHIKYIRNDTTGELIEGYKKQIWGRDAVLLDKCPKCKEGSLMIKRGKYGKFLGCTKYPKCDYAIAIKNAREENKKSINEQIISDIRRAYT